MKKVLFFDYRELESVDGFTRRLEQPVKEPANPLFIADQPWENGNMQLYGSVVKASGKPFQLWYTVIHAPWHMFLACAESEDGLTWRKPLLDLYEFEGQKTNILFTPNPHGAAVIYDDADPRPDWKYKMVAGTDPSGCITTYHSEDGIHWEPVRRFPAIVTNPDCPMGFLRRPDGRYVIYHRVHGLGRRPHRSESWDFGFWSGEPRMVLEPEAGDPPQLQFYGLGSAAYGSYEIGTLWAYHTYVDDTGPGKLKGCQEAELTYARSGYAWHRAAQGEAFIPHGAPGSWEQGNLQCASQPVFLDDEIRYYYMGTTMCHKVHWELDPQTAGLGMARLKPDRFVALVAGEAGQLLTVPFTPPSVDFSLNAAVGSGGSVRAELLDGEAKPIPGFTAEECVPITGDSVAHRVQWKGGALAADTRVRVRVTATNARLYSIFVSEPDETPVYHRFEAMLP